MTHDIFISYSRRDLAAVKPIREELESHGVSCWMDLEGIESGSEEFTDKIATAIEESSTTLFFLSNGSQESRWSLNELRVARDEGKHIVLVRFNDDRMKIKFKLEFGGSDIIDWRQPEQKAKLLRDLKEWLEEKRRKEATILVEEGKRLEGTDNSRAVECFRRAADLGNEWACVKLGDCFRDGTCVSQDFAQAAAWYRRVAGRDPEEDWGATQWAEWNLGNFCRNGLGVERDHDKALGWYRKSAARKGGAAEASAVAAAEVYSELLSARIKPALGSFWTSFREVSGVRMKDERGRIVPLAGLVASDRGIFIGLSLDGLRIGIEDPLPDTNPVPAFVSAVSGHCGLPMDWISGFVIVPDGFRIPGSSVLPPWTIRETEVAAGLLSVPSRLDWAHVYRDVIRKLETLDMSSAGAETNALFHFDAPMPEWEDGAALLRKVERPTPRLFASAHRAVVELDRAGKGTVAKTVFEWLGKFDEASPILTKVAADVFFNLRRIPAKEGELAAFWMGETQVTQRLWTAVMGSNPSHFKGDDRRPVECVSWEDCQEFLRKLNALDEVRLTGLAFRLPTSEEWAHACRAGGTEKYCRLADGTEITEETIDRVAWFDGNSNGTTHPVGLKEPNAWGLYDMHGNVGEWTATADGGKRIERGGSWCFSAAHCRSLPDGWGSESPSFWHYNLGFRLCASVP